jgi:hypothetical protein
LLWYDCGNGWQRAHMARKDLGLDAVLCCPGPSLKNTPYLRGKGRKVFAINTAYPTVKPDIWLGMDEPHCYDANLFDEPFPKILRGPYAKRTHINRELRTYPETYFADVKPLPNGKTIFDLRQHDVNFAWYKHTLGVALHFMVWMGAKNIYLVGCDLGGAEDYCHGLELKPEHRKVNRRLYAQQVVFLEEIAQQGKKYGVTLHSSTPNSPINEFLPYTSVDDLITRHPRVPSKVRHVLDKPVTICTVLKSGGEYTPEHVKRLAKQIPNLKCFSDISVPGVHCIPLKHNLPGWWSKLELFGPSIDGDILYMDLDTTVLGDLTPFIEVGKTTMLEDFYFKGHAASGLMYIKQSDKKAVFEAFMADKENIMRQIKKAPLHGDQGFLNSVLKPELWQKVLPGKVVSYKVDCQNAIPDEASVVCFHGKPRPWDIPELFRG